MDDTFFHDLLYEKHRPPSIQNFCLTMVLPLGEVHASIQDARQVVKDESFQLLCSRTIAMDVQMIGGSTSDGLELPEITHMDTRNKVVEGQDEDILYIIPYLTVDPYMRRAFARPVPIADRPGYIKLEFNQDWLRKRPVPFYSKYEFDESNYLNPQQYVSDEGFVLRQKLKIKMKSNMGQDIHSSNKELDLINIENGRNSTVQFSSHGPAATVDIVETKYNICQSKDYVIALPHPSWPEQAIGWVNRERSWPARGITRSVLKSGCHVIPKAHHCSKDSEEFHLSFGLASRTIAHALNVPQVRCYKLFKYLFKYHINKVKRGLSSFHCKQVMFWTCEKSRQDSWTDKNPFECLQRLLGQFIVYLGSHNIPNYFIENANTIDHIGKKAIQAITKDVQEVTDTCWYIILEVTNLKRFSWLSKDISLLKLISPCLSSANLSKEVMISTVMKYSSHLLDKGNIHQVLNITGVDHSATNWLDDAISKLKYLIGLSTDESVMCCFKGFQATLYCQRALQFQKNQMAKDYNTYIGICRVIFKDIIGTVGEHTWICGEYYNLLSSQGQHLEIVEHFANFILPSSKIHPSKLYQGGIYTAINAHNRLTTEYCIREGMQDFVVPTTAYLLFKVIHACLTLHTLETYNSDNFYQLATKSISHFKKWAEYKFVCYPELNDEHIHVLLAYSFDAVGISKQSEKYFKRAESFGMAYKEEADDLMYIEPVLTQLRHISREHRKLLSKPYRKPSKRIHLKQKRRLNLRFGEIRINPFLHY